jgi:hypothetical protein
VTYHEQFADGVQVVDLLGEKRRGSSVRMEGAGL